MARKQSKPAAQEVPPGSVEVYKIGEKEPTGYVDQQGFITPLKNGKPVEAHDKKILSLMLQLCDGVQALNGSIYPWKQIREDIVSLMEK